MPASTTIKKRARSDSPESETDISSTQENASARQQNKRPVRHRASVACTACRDRRIRCVVPKGGSECTQCERTGVECVIRNDDERRRPISKAYMSSLSDRINILEAMLLEKGVVPPPANYPPKTKQEAAQLQRQHSSESYNPAACGREESASPSNVTTNDEDIKMQDSSSRSDQAHAEIIVVSPLLDDSQSPTDPSPGFGLDGSCSKRDDIFQNLLSTNENLSSTGPLPGPPPPAPFQSSAANNEPFCRPENSPRPEEPGEAPEQMQRLERVIRMLAPTTHDYLMNCFWEYFNEPLFLVDKGAFEAGRRSKNPRFYSSLLHVAMLAMGFRYANKRRDDVVKISVGNRESSLHREAKCMLDVELERPGGIPTVQALLILADLECGVARVNTGWIYSGIANQLALDAGLRLDSKTGPGLTQHEISVQHRVAQACVNFSRHWALWLGRPGSNIKSQGLGMELLLRQLSSRLPDGSTSQNSHTHDSGRKPLAAEIYHQLVELMAITGSIVDLWDSHRMKKAQAPNLFTVQDDTYCRTVHHIRRLQSWYRNLPDHLTWKPANVKTAPSSFFLLHQQYHVSLILLHRPWANYPSLLPPNNPNTTPHQHSPTPTTPRDPDSAAAAVGVSRQTLSRRICIQQAVQICRVLRQHRQRLDGKKISVSALHHAGTAAMALISAMAVVDNDNDNNNTEVVDHQHQERRSYLDYLEFICQAIRDMGETYQPAEKMDALLSGAMLRLRTGDGRRHHHPIVVDGGGGGGGGGSAFLGRTNNGSPSPVVLPARRRNSDTDQETSQRKRLRFTASSRRASELARPPPSVFFPGQHVNAWGGGPLHRPTTTTQPLFPYETKSLTLKTPTFGLPVSHALPSSTPERDWRHAPSPVSTTIDMDVPLFLASPPKDDWQLQHESRDPELQIPDWIAQYLTPTGVSGKELIDVVGTSSPGSSIRSSGSGSSSSGRGSSSDTQSVCSSSVEWMSSNSDGSSSTSSSVISLEDLVLSVEKAIAGAAGTLDVAHFPPTPRKIELDFFSF